MSEADDDFDDRFDLATADATIAVLRERLVIADTTVENLHAVIRNLHQQSEDRQQWRSRMGLTVSTDAAVEQAIAEERLALREIPDLLLSRRCLKNDINTYDYRTGWHNAMEHAANVVRNRLASFPVREKE